MNVALGDLKENPLWIYRVLNYSNESSGLSCDKLLKKWKFHPHIIKVLNSKNISELFPVQEKTIPLLLNDSHRDRYSVFSCDFIVTAPTGTTHDPIESSGQGKTLSYVLPLINNIVNLRENRLNALVLVPSRELLKQTYQVFSWFVDSNPLTYDLRGRLLKVRVFYGDRSFVKFHESLVNDPPHVAICTPGVLVEYFLDFDENASYSVFSHLKWIVIDEVDVMLQQSFYEWSEVISNLTRKLKGLEVNRKQGFPQKILLSATVPLKSHEIETLQLNRPVLLRLEEIIFKFPKNLSQKYILVSKRSRNLTLLKLLTSLYLEKEPGNVIVFFSSIQTCHETLRLLQTYICQENPGFKALEFTSKLSQKHRNRVINTYKNEKRVCLLCSDVASRGIDLSNTSTVVSYDFPARMSTYVHRAGRTARGNKEGSFYVFVSQSDEKKFNQFVRRLKISEEVKRVDQGEILDGKRSEKLETMFPRLVEMSEKCLLLESSAKIPYHSELESFLGLLDT